MGLHPDYKEPEEMQSIIDKYIIDCNENNKSPTITGLTLALGFCSRQSFYDYEKKPHFTYTIKRARLMIENVYESNLHLPSPTGAIFALKNFGWNGDQQVIHEHNNQLSEKDKDILRRAKLLEEKDDTKPA